MVRRSILFASLLTLSAALAQPTLAQDQVPLITFERTALTDIYFSEGANAGDINGDGKLDVVYGPYWFEGPDFRVKHEIFEPKPQNRESYADNFFSWVYDFNGDGAADVFVVGFPGTPAYVYENPGKGNYDKHWKKHQVFDSVSNESPHFTNLVGDERPELICTRDGYFGYAVINWERPFEAWAFHPISEQLADRKFGHGLGVGDVNGDGRLDILHSGGWFEQPESLDSQSRWRPHLAEFTPYYGGAEMYAYDVDGDGDNDIITSQAAHDFGLAWYEQVREGEQVTFKEHLIMGSHPGDNRYGVLFSELHSVALADIDGDGLKDIVTGKTYYSHHQKSPMWDAGAVVYWFKLVRGEKGVDFVPYKIDGVSGIGRQLSLADLNGDGALDVVVGGMVGGSVLIQKRTLVSKEEYERAQPKPYTGPPPPSTTAKALRGPKSKLGDAGAVAGAIEGESLNARVSAGRTSVQEMGGFRDDVWSDGKQLFWGGAAPGATLDLEIPAKDGDKELEIVFTCARDYAIVQLSIDGETLGEPIDLFEGKVVTSGALKFPLPKASGATRKLRVTILGANRRATPAHLVGIDYILVR